MSLSLAMEEENRRRGYSGSRSRDQRAYDEPLRDQPRYSETRDIDDRHKSSRRRNDLTTAELPYPRDGGMDSMIPGVKSLYSYPEDSRPVYRTVSPKKEEAQLPGAFPDENHRRDAHDARHSMKYERQAEASYDKQGKHDYEDRKLRYLPQKYSHQYDDDVESRKSDRRSKKERDEENLAYGNLPPASMRQDNYSYGYRALGPDEHPDEGRRDSPRRGHQGHRSSKSLDVGSETRRHSDSDHDDHRDDYDARKSSSYRHSHQEDDRDPRSQSKSDSWAVEPSSHGRDRSQTRRAPTLVVETDYGDGERPTDVRRGNGRDSSPLPPRLSAARGGTEGGGGGRGHRTNLSVDTTRLGAHSLASAPASPMLESYHGTYQDCSPMPSPLLLASKSPLTDDMKSLEALSPLNSDGEGSKKLSRRARFHDAEDIAFQLAQALKGNDMPKIGPLIEILPSLTHEQVMELRAEYKQIVKTGSDRKGVNIAKHIRARLKDEDAVLMKACYAVALGKWESEAYWANFWYQGDKTRRELLIESLMGRTNDEIRRIKDSFTDKKYDNSLTKCMKTELKEDKFKRAVLMVLDEGRMEEYDHHGRRLSIDYKQVDSDVAELRKAIKSDKGGETLMISIVVQRSESHLRAVLQEYEHKYRANFAREALKKSGNLVGELLAHILNGIINRPVRDALLLNHALTASRKDQLRRELLISRLIRFHWEPAHMQEVKRAYRERYGQDLQDAVKEATTSEWGMFCRELCIARMPDHVRRIERVDRTEE